MMRVSKAPRPSTRDPRLVLETYVLVVIVVVVPTGVVVATTYPKFVQYAL